MTIPTPSVSNVVPSGDQSILVDLILVIADVLALTLLWMGVGATVLHQRRLQYPKQSDTTHPGIERIYIMFFWPAFRKQRRQ